MRMQLGGPLVPARAVDLDPRLEARGVQLLGPGEHVGGAAETFLEVVGALDHRRVEAGPGHHREALAVEAPDVQLPAVAVERDLDRLGDVALDAEVRREQVGGPGGGDRERDLHVLERVDAAPDHPVTSPGEDQLGAILQGLLDRGRRPLALRHLVHSGSETPASASVRRSSGSPPAERLAGMGDDRNLHPRARLSAAAPAARQANSRTRIAPMPIEHASGNVERMVHPLVHAREGDEGGQEDRAGPGQSLLQAAGEAGGEQQDEAGVDRDRGGGVARGVAGVGRQVFEAVDRGAVARDRE